MGHLLTTQGLKPDPKKVEAIIKLPTPKSKEDIERLNGTVNYLVKFLPRLSHLMEPLRRLTQTGVEWHWEDGVEKAFSEVKHLVTQAPILAYCSRGKELVIQCDASSRCLGAVLLQEVRPLAYASRALTDPETRYATIEKEMLAVVFALEKWHQFAYGRHVLVNTDHNPPEAISKKPLDRAPKRLQGMLLRILAHYIGVQYTPGYTQHLADMMSRSFIPAGNQGTPSEFEAINAVQFLPMRPEKIQKLQLETSKDETLQLLKATILEGWPEERSALSTIPLLRYERRTWRV
ncbi:Retrovirus-related Pol polyprotein from transposon 17.6 [Acropora cervicornis]|uniref:Retrovirus-related Pol polyprotein from transposon 17.6 n=1 Tax=Acropora cervicornis TaxID=6130 RepID=A0AAD9QRX5_ACRCE|nr:Retrovirus-related Pol polyprotein from transposon 17.6 [Acropora cervicornis]